MLKHIFSKNKLFFPKDKLSFEYLCLIFLKYIKVIGNLDIFLFYLRKEIFHWFNEKNRSFFFLCLIKLIIYYLDAALALLVLFTFVLLNAKEPFLLTFTFTFFYLSFVIYYSNFTSFEPLSILYVIILIYFIRDFLFFFYYWFFWLINYILYSFFFKIKTKLKH